MSILVILILSTGAALAMVYEPSPRQECVATTNRYIYHSSSGDTWTCACTARRRLRSTMWIPAMDFAWRRLVLSIGPRSEAQLHRMHKNVYGPPTSRRLGDVLSDLDEWEGTQSSSSKSVNVSKYCGRTLAFGYCLAAFHIFLRRFYRSWKKLEKMGKFGFPTFSIFSNFFRRDVCDSP